ncbi:MAG TPA: SMC-Scp complex subunit ScpB [Candidatus Avacidaminococcus intestinavium]|uniref:SMC-Scp complex subunit ScpB n=1 Tax=Candidatus Avacidaminococcus intestinavium TaxID=2840684 RepID=A0A9D1MR30_9FIRM|nr:SMC-Scp complex subunit ScpB [Candidatus Avacidaminococcus intestinavium]
MFYDYLRGHVEALLFAAGDPLSLQKISELLEIEEGTAERLLALLTAEYDANERGFCLRKVANGYQLVVKPQFDELVRRLVTKQEIKLSNAALETLSIIVFKQPVTRSEIEAIRGVKVDGVVNTLVEHGLICELGRKDTIGKPILYGTTDLFLTMFGFNSITEIPKITVNTETVENKNDA